MAIVADIVGSVDRFLGNISSTTFGALAAPVGQLFTAMAVLAIIIVALNMMFQFRAVTAWTAFTLMGKLALISIFALNWADFNAVASALYATAEQLGGVIIRAVGGTPPGGALGIATEFDELIKSQLEASNAISNNMRWVGGAMFSVASMVLLGILGAAAALVVVFGKVMFAFYAGIAPIMIVLSMFSVTRDYFQSWLSGMISYAFYPVVVGAAFGAIISMSKVTLGDADQATSLGALVPYFIVSIMSVFVVVMIPMIVSQLSGNIALGSPMTAVGATAGAMGTARALGLMQQRNPNPRDPNPPGPPKPPGGGAGRPGQAAAAQVPAIVRIAERNAKYRK